MPTNDEATAKRRMVVEEIEIPEKTSETHSEKPAESTKPDILDEGVKVSSHDLTDEKSTHSPEKPVYSPRKQGSPFFWIVIPGIFILGAILGGIIYYEKGVNTISPEATPTMSSSATPISTPTPSATADVSKFAVAIFNGSGIPGEAAKAKELLASAGFNVVSTGNAASYDFTKTIIKAKSSVDPSVIQKLKDTLSKNYLVGDSQTLTASSANDIEVTIGSSKAE